MAFEDKTQNNIIIDLKAAIEPDTSTEEGTLIDHSFRGAAAEFEKAYIELELIDQNGYAETADREHLILLIRGGHCGYGGNAGEACGDFTHPRSLSDVSVGLFSAYVDPALYA